MSVQVGDRISLRIDSLAFGGDGLGRHEGFVVFVPFTAPGDTVEVEITEKSARHSRGKVTSVLNPASTRTEPLCPYFQRCGGCQYQHLTYEEELRAKELQVRDSLVRIARIPEPPILPIIGCPQPYGYRNRITVHAEDNLVGFRGTDPREIVDITHCALATKEVNQTLDQLRASRPKPGHYSLRHPGIPPSAFFQVNHLLLETLRQTVAATFPAGLAEGIDAYCGGGFFTSELVKKFGRVTGIEKDGRSLKDARRIPADNLQLIEGDVALELEAILRETNLASAGLLLDPPREGLPASLVRTLIELRPAALTYVSCHPPTLARDAQKLIPHYNLISVQPLDLFPRTGQIECITTWAAKS